MKTERKSCLNCGKPFIKNLSYMVCDKCFPRVVSTEPIKVYPK